MQDFMFHAPTQLFFGETAVDHLAESVAKFGDRVLIVYGGGSVKRIGLYDKITEIFKSNNIFYKEVAGVSPNPKMGPVREGIALCRAFNLQMVLAVGGGSTIDTAKSIATGYYYDGDITGLIGQWWLTDVLPVLTIPTLAGSGSEMTTSAVLNNEETQTKASFHGPQVRPRVSFLNPAYTFTVPKNQTAAGVADALSHTFESYFSHIKGAYLHARFSEALFKTLFEYGPIAYNEPENYEARANVMLACTWACNGFNVKGNYVMWTCHILENELSGYDDKIPHGEGLAILTPRWLRWALDEQRAYRYVDMGVNVFGIDPSLPDMEIAELMIQKVEDFFFNTMNMPSRLRDYGIPESALEQMAANVIEKKDQSILDIMWKPVDKAGVLEILKASY